MRKLDHKREGGFILVESMGGLLFYLVMLGAIGGLVVMLFSGSKLATMEQEIGAIRLQVRQLYTSTGDYTGLDTALAVSSGAIPDSLIKSGGAVKNSWSGNVTVGVGTDSTTFEITVGNIPQSEATKLAGFQAGSWVDVLVNDTSIVAAANPVSAASAAATATNTITFISN